MTRIPTPDEVLALAAEQAGLVTRAQLEAHGITARALRARLVHEWRLVLPGVVLLSRLALPTEARPLAAQLMAGQDARITGRAGARLLGLANAGEVRQVDLLVPATRATRTVAFVRLSRTDRMPAAATRFGLLAVAPPARVVGDACRATADLRYARALVIEAVQRRKVTVATMFDELFAGPTRGSATLRAAIEAAGSGAWSVAEHDLIRVVRRSRVLPEPWPNPMLRDPSGGALPTPDLWFDDVGLAVQVHSHAHHAAGEQWTATIRADSALAEAGVLRLAFTPREIRREPDQVLDRIERAHRSLTAARRPQVVALRRA
ncbi:hypothetical protein KIN34_11060 [Cellulomonas sp. DKR-3]|uniref:DUF559 domain-containing protein n=1 Tax=Cellulomonas fulva TaxID=2835530 RepID=A0ABS5U092_9CELL|nr:type IV toxin-antitoxin system AbiEi family antitoxin domain-containing protein [Cellulomonas fulva]MBT0994819.1 hypothetical protein [Cellulomonas fulva]